MISVRAALFIRLEAEPIGGLEGDGGAYPECHIAQYPLELGRKKVSTLGMCRVVKL